MQEMDLENEARRATTEQASSVGPLDTEMETDQPSSTNDQNMDLVMQIPVSVEVLLGSARMRYPG